MKLNEKNAAWMRGRQAFKRFKKGGKRKKSFISLRPSTRLKPRKASLSQKYKHWTLLKCNKDIPNYPACYVVISEKSGEALYVGSTTKLRPKYNKTHNRKISFAK